MPRGRGLLGVGRLPAPGHCPHYRVGRPPWPEAAGGVGGQPGACGKRAGRVLPHGERRGMLVRRGPRAHDGRGAGRRGARAGRGRGAGAWREHEAQPLVRPQLRVLQRGPAFGRRAGGRLHRGRAEPGRGNVAQALRLQQPGDEPADRGRGRGRARAARAVPGAVPHRGGEGPALDDDDGVQPAGWRVLLRERRASGARARRMGLRRRLRERLGRRERQ